MEGKGPVTAEIIDACVESYSGYRGDEVPRAVIIDSVRLEVVEVLLRKRSLDRLSGGTADIWRCRLEDGRTVTIELFEDGAWRVSAAA
jgi:hypothetical protein